MSYLDKDKVIFLSEEGESEYASTPPSGRGDGSLIINKDEVISKAKSISLRKPMVMIVGSVATQGSSDNDIDIVVRGEDLSEKVKEAISFRLYRLFTGILGCEYDDIRKYVHIHYNNVGSYTTYIPLYELVLRPCTDMHTIQMSTIPFNLKGNITILAKSKKDRIIAGYASVIEIDQENQIIPKEALKDGIEKLLKNSEYANLMLVHQNIQIGQILSEYGDLKTHVDEKGLFIVAKIRSDLQTANEVWKSIEKHELNGFSIAAEVLLDHEECDKSKCWTVVDKINIFEISVCDKPVNVKSGFVIISKNCNETNVCNCDVNIKEKANMKAIAKAKPKEEEVPKEPESCKEEKGEADIVEDNIDEGMPTEPEGEVVENAPTIEETLEALSREIEALKGAIAELQNPNEELPPEDEELPEEDMEEAKPTPEDEELPPAEGENPEPSNYPYPSKKDFDELKVSVDSLAEQIANTKETDELKLSLKSKDDQIKALTKRLEIIEKAEKEPKVLSEPEEEFSENDEEPLNLVRDAIRTGVLYRDVD